MRARTFSTEGMNPEAVRMVQDPAGHDFSGTSAKQKELTLPQIFLLNAVVCGVEICACAGFTFIPPMLLKSGYTEENMSIILGLGPLLGFFLVPLIGRASDRCQSSIGRRRPFILVLSLVLIMSLIVIPYGDMFCNHVLGKGEVAKSFSLTLLTLGVVMLDFTSQACLTPCEALLSDASKDTDQHERVFIVYSLMVSLGGFIGYLITALDWNSMQFGSFFGNQERTVFSLLTIIFTCLLLATTFVAQEKPLISIVGEQNLPHSTSATKLTVGNGNIEMGLMENGGLLEQRLDISQSPKSSRTRTSSPQSYLPKLNILRYIVNCRLVAAVLNLLRLFWISIHEKLPEPIQRLCEVPFCLRYLALAHFCSWTAIMGFNLFYTDYVGNAVYQGNPNAPEDSYLRNRFDEGVRMGSWGLLLHCITSAVYALFVEKFVDRYGCKRTYLAGMISFSCAMLGMVCVRNIVFVNIMAAFTGFGYATVTTIPFILVTKYHNEKEIFFYDVIQPSGSRQLPPRGIATDMATLDSAYFLSQVILSGIMGYIVYMTGSVLSYMVTAGVMGVLSCFFIQKVMVNKQEIMIFRQRQFVNI